MLQRFDMGHIKADLFRIDLSALCTAELPVPAFVILKCRIPQLFRRIRIDVLYLCKGEVFHFLVAKPNRLFWRIQIRGSDFGILDVDLPQEIEFSPKEQSEEIIIFVVPQRVFVLPALLSGEPVVPDMPGIPASNLSKVISSNV